MNRRSLAALVAPVAVLGFTTIARADPRSVRLEYTLARGAERCPAEQVFRDIVGGRMLSNPDPFADDASMRLVVSITYEAGRYRGRAELFDGTNLVWSDPVKPDLRDCRTVIHALGSAVANKLAVREPSEPPPKPAQPPAVPLAPVQTAAAKPAERAFRIRLGLNGALAVWISPSDFAFEAAGDVGLRWRVFSLSAELRASPPFGAERPFSLPSTGTAQPLSSGGYAVDVSTSRVAGALVPCFHWTVLKGHREGGFFACAVVQAGGVFSSGKNLESGSMPYAASGLRLGFELDITRWLGARLGSDFLGVLSRPALRTEGQPVWIASPFSMAFGGGFVASF